MRLFSFIGLNSFLAYTKDKRIQAAGMTINFIKTWNDTVKYDRIIRKWLNTDDNNSVKRSYVMCIRRHD